MAEINDLDPTDANNTAIGGINSQGSSAPSNMDNVMRALSGMLGRMKSGAAAIYDTMTWCDPADTTKKFRFDGGGITASNTRVVTIADADVTLPNQSLGTSDSPQFAGINVEAASDTTITRVSAGVIAVEGVTLMRASQNLADVSSAATACSNIKQAASDTATGVVELSTDAEGIAGTDTARAMTPANITARQADAAAVRAATTKRLVDGAAIESASAIVSLTDAATVAVDWDTFVNADVTLTASRLLGNPTNVQVGVCRTITVKGNNSTDRTLTFDTYYKGDIPTLTDIDSGKWYTLTLLPLSATHIVVSYVTALKP